jgi:hypothetical protein
MQCFQLSSDFPHLLPSDLDGTTAPPSGSPNYFLNFGTNSLNLWKFTVDFSNSNNTKVTGPTNIPVAKFTEACGGGICIPQPGSTELLDSLGNRLMYRLAYRNFVGHESLVVNHSVTAGPSVGLRWYEIRNPNGTPTVFQQGTFAPDTNFRWMGSMAMDRVGNIAIGYSISSSSINPSIRFTGRLAEDTLGTLEGEQTIMPGGGSQLKLSNWGDYSSISIDPVDDCTFWYTTEYLPAPGEYDWSVLQVPVVYHTGGVKIFHLPPLASLTAVHAGSTLSARAICLKGNRSMFPPWVLFLARSHRNSIALLKLDSDLERAAARIAGLLPEFLFDPDELIIFREPVRARERAGFDLAAIGRDGKVGNRRILGFAGAV